MKREVGWAYVLFDDDPTRLLLPVTIGQIERSDFSPESGWLYLRDFKRIEATYQPYPLAETVTRTRQLLGLTHKGEAPAPSQPQTQEDVDDLLTRAKALIAQQQHAEAIPFLERVTKQAPNSFDGWANLGFVYDKPKRYADALAAY